MNINDVYRTSSEKSGNVLLLRLNLVNRIYKLLNIKVGIYFLG